MDYPFGHNRRPNHHHHQHKPDYEDDEDYPPPNFHNQPPPNFPGGFRDEQPPPPPHPNFYDNQPPPPPNFPGPGVGAFIDEPPPPPFSAAPVTHHQHRPDYYGEDEIGGYQQPHHYQGVQHVSHHLDHYGGGGNGGDYNTNNSNYVPSFIHHHQHTSSASHEPAPAPEMINKPTVRVYSKADTAYSLTIRDSQVVLAPSDPRDPFQHWIKDLKFSTRVKDEEGFPCFALVNKATGEAIKHSIAATQPVQLVPYNPNAFDESVLWTESKDLGDSYRCIRMVNNIRLNLDAFNGDKNHGGVHDGTIAVLWEWKKGDNQRWKIAPY